MWDDESDGSDDDTKMHVSARSRVASNDSSLLLGGGAVLLILGVPQGTEMGLDCRVWQTGPHFKGIKGVPQWPSLHFLYCSPGSFRSGNFFSIGTQPDQLLVWQWDPAVEHLVQETDPEQLERFRYNINEFLPFLGPFLPDLDSNANDDDQTIDLASKWERLSSHMSPALILRVLPTAGAVSAMTSTSRFSDVPVHSSQQQQNNYPADCINFTHIDLKRSFPEGATGPLLTKYSIDKSHLLGSLLMTAYNSDYIQLLAEFQLSFIIFLLGQVYDGFEQWKTIVQLVCFSQEAIPEHPNLFAGFLDQLLVQLGECPEDFFHDTLASGSFLHTCIKTIAKSIKQK
eukprot:jgi/Hompol1/1147/HPOL_001242-RA